MPGVARSNVAVTDTFDTWRIRTNEINDSLNLGTHAITGNTIVWRDDDGSFYGNVATINTISMTHGTSTTTLNITSALAAEADGTKASIKTTGGILTGQESRFQAALVVEGNLTTNANVEFGDNIADTLEINSSLVGHIIPNANVTSNLGSTAKEYLGVYTKQAVFNVPSNMTGSIIDITSLGDSGANAVNIIANAEDTGYGLNLSMGGLTTGGMFKMVSDSDDTNPRTLGSIIQEHASGVNVTNLHLRSDAGRGLFVETTLAAGKYSFEIDAAQQTSNTAKIDSAATSGTMLELVASGVLTGNGVNYLADSATTGIGMAVSMDALTTGKILDLSSTSSSNATRSLIKITNDDTGATGTTVLEIDSDAGRGVYINSGLAGSLPSLEITSALETTNTAIITADDTDTGTVLQISADALTSGRAIDISSTSSSSTSRRLVSITNDDTGATGTDALYIKADAGKGVYITSTLADGGPALDIDSSLASTNTVQILADSTTTGTAIELSADALTSGKGLSITSTGTHSGQLVSLISDGAATGPTLYMKSDATSGTVKVAQFANSSADIFSVEQTGDVAVGRDLSVGGNLHVQGATTQINTTQTLVKDKTLILGTAGDVVANKTYTQHGTAPSVTVTGHGLSTNDIIYCVTANAAPAVITSETLYKVTVVDSNTFTLALRDGTAINTSSDATGRTFSYVGAQTDAIVDDAGLYIPGGSGVHTVKWDDTDNYWKVNDSFLVDSTSQLVFPKGTTGERPAGSATSTVAAATPGAMRYNSTDKLFEGVHDGTTFDGMSTQSFSTAMAIALG